MAEEKQKPKTKYLAARLKANKKYNSKTYWQKSIYFPKDMERKIRENSGNSINNFIVTAVREKLERMGKCGE